MIRRAACALLLLVASSATLVLASDPAAACPGDGTATLETAGASCDYESKSDRDTPDDVSADAHEYRYEPRCGLGGGVLCHQFETCYLDGKEGAWYDVYRDGEFIGPACVTDAEVAEARQVTPAMVLRKFKSLSWAAGDLTIQPPKGITLVNMATVFSTTTTGHQTHKVTLLGQHITIEAWPASYTWIHGDGTQQTTTSPGKTIHPPPGVALQDVDLTGTVNHRYRTKGSVQVRLDLTYQGRYRLNNGPWTAIPGTLTVTGTPQRLDVRTASPVLVG